MSITPKSVLIENNQKPSKPLYALSPVNDYEEIKNNYFKTVEEKIKRGLVFGEAIFSFTIGGEIQNLIDDINDELTRGGYDFTYENNVFRDENTGEIDYSRVSYHIPLGERTPRLCDGCSSELKNFTGDQSLYQFDNALWLGFHGGYGMFLDDGDGRSPNEAVLCHECAHKLFDTFPNFKKELFDPYDSHSHTEEYHKLHPDHYGWDYDDED